MTQNVLDINKNKMKVKDLIEVLSQHDAELPVLVEGYEGGCNNVDLIEEIEVIKDVNTAWYYGSHEKVRNLHGSVISDFAKKGKLPSKGLLITAIKF
jgi:hypothetical protein